MKSSHATLAGVAVVTGMCAGIVYGVRAGNAALTITAFLLGVFLLFLVRRSVTTVMEDEWTRLVEGKSASLTLSLAMFLFTIVGLFLVTVSSPEHTYDMAVYAIAGFLVTLSVLQVGTTLYYRRVLRGKES